MLTNLVELSHKQPSPLTVQLLILERCKKKKNHARNSTPHTHTHTHTHTSVCSTKRRGFFFSFVLHHAPPESVLWSSSGHRSQWPRLGMGISHAELVRLGVTWRDALSHLLDLCAPAAHNLSLPLSLSLSFFLLALLGVRCHAGGGSVWLDVCLSYAAVAGAAGLCVRRLDSLSCSHSRVGSLSSYRYASALLRFVSASVFSLLIVVVFVCLSLVCTLAESCV
jgi:hypothetical protein